MWPCAVDALEAGDDDHLAGGQVGAHARVVDALDARLGVGRVGDDRHLPAGVAHRLQAFGLQRDAPAGPPRPARRWRRSCRARASARGRALGGAVPWPGRAGGWSRRSSPRARRPSGGRRAPIWRRAWRRCGCARSSPSRCRRTCERSSAMASAGIACAARTGHCIGEPRPARRAPQSLSAPTPARIALRPAPPARARRCPGRARTASWPSADRAAARRAARPARRRPGTASSGCAAACRRRAGSARRRSRAQLAAVQPRSGTPTRRTLDRMRRPSRRRQSCRRGRSRRRRAALRRRSALRSQRPR